MEHKAITAVLEDIRTGKYKPAIIYLRKSLAEQKMEAYEKAKKALPAFTPSGKFQGGRKPEFLKQYSGIIVLDIDKLTTEQLQTATAKVRECPYTFAAFISPSGNGLKVLVQVNTQQDQHKEAFLKAQELYEKLLELPIDKSGKDYTRLCFFSYDEKLFHNPDAQVLVIANEENQSGSGILGQAPVILSDSEGSHQQIPATPSPDYTAVYEHCKRFTEKKVQYTNGSRNVFVHQLACNLNRKAVPLSAALGYILAEFNYDDKEVTATVNSAYANLHEFGNKTGDNNSGNDLSNKTVDENGSILEDNKAPSSFGDGAGDEADEDKPKPTIIDRLENYLTSKYIFRHNIVSGKLEFRQIKAGSSSSPSGRPGGAWLVMNDFIENSMLRECLKARLKTNLSSLRNLLYSDFCPLYNPFQDYFQSLPTWDEATDHITQLANTITTTKQELWQQCFKKWLVAMAGCVLSDKIINHTVIVFSGRQGLGKTTWMEKLVPKQLKEYLFSGTINPNNKDTLVHLAECMLINLDELENLNRSEIGSLKEIITKTQIRIRRAYGHNNETMPRRASFAGSVNTAQFLNDTTGSRRFLCFEVEAIQYQHHTSMEQVYAQALHLLNNGFKYWFDQEEIKAITENNEQYQLRSPEEELLITWFSPCDKETASLFINASQIAARLAEKAKLNVSYGTVNKIGKALKKHNFIRLKKNGVFVYALKEHTWEEVENLNRSVTNTQKPESDPPKPPEQGNLPFQNGTA